MGIPREKEVDFTVERLDKALVARKLVASRSQAESYIKLGLVSVNKQVVQKPGFFVRDSDQLAIAGEQYVSRAARFFDRWFY